MQCGSHGEICLGRVLRRGANTGPEGQDEAFREGGPEALRRRQEDGGLRGRPVMRRYQEEEQVVEEGRTGWIGHGRRSLFSPRLR